MRLSAQKSVFIIVLFHLVGLAGFLIPASHNLFKQLVPYHLLLMLVLLLMNQDMKDKYFLMFLVITYIVGFLVELTGIQTGLIFGDYTYGETLGAKFAGTPLMIGVNWILVICSAGMIIRKAGITTHLAAATAGAAAVTLLDFLIEPVAVKFDYWHWHGNIIPLQNYAGWFVVAFFLQLLFVKLPFKKENPAAVALFVAQFVFFLVLNF